jgi:hypothetical protein
LKMKSVFLNGFCPVFSSISFSSWCINTKNILWIICLYL